MSTTLIEIRRAKPTDASDVALAHDEAWRAAYQGIIPGTEPEKLISRRGPEWWHSPIRHGSRIVDLEGAGEGDEFQGLGFGRRLFTAARRDLAQSGLKSLVIWALSDNDPAVEFYRALGGRAVARSSERFGTKVLDKVAFAWQS